MDADTVDQVPTGPGGDATGQFLRLCLQARWNPAAVDAARASLRIVSNQYREGLATMVDLLDVQAAATGAEGDLVQARHDYRVDLARLSHAAGRSYDHIDHAGDLGDIGEGVNP